MALLLFVVFFLSSILRRLLPSFRSIAILNVTVEDSLHGKEPLTGRALKRVKLRLPGKPDWIALMAEEEVLLAKAHHVLFCVAFDRTLLFPDVPRGVEEHRRDHGEKRAGRE